VIALWMVEDEGTAGAGAGAGAAVASDGAVDDPQADASVRTQIEQSKRAGFVVVMLVQWADPTAESTRHCAQHRAGWWWKGVAAPGGGLASAPDANSRVLIDGGTGIRFHDDRLYACTASGAFGVPSSRVYAARRCNDRRIADTSRP
jgi:hypothetical protein